MMPKLRLSSLVAAFLLMTTGCGTLANLDGRKLALIDMGHQETPTPFGGVGRDLRWIASGAVFFIMDIPFSLFADIVTLPKVLKMRGDGYHLWAPLQRSEPNDPVTQEPAEPTTPGGAACDLTPARRP